MLAVLVWIGVRNVRLGIICILLLILLWGMLRSLRQNVFVNVLPHTSNK